MPFSYLTLCGGGGGDEQNDACRPVSMGVYVHLNLWRMLQYNKSADIIHEM